MLAAVVALLRTLPLKLQYEDIQQQLRQQQGLVLLLAKVLLLQMRRTHGFLSTAAAARYRQRCRTCHPPRRRSKEVGPVQLLLYSQSGHTTLP